MGRADQGPMAPDIGHVPAHSRSLVQNRVIVWMALFNSALCLKSAACFGPRVAGSWHSPVTSPGVCPLGRHYKLCVDMDGAENSFQPGQLESQHVSMESSLMGDMSAWWCMFHRSPSAERDVLQSVSLVENWLQSLRSSPIQVFISPVLPADVQTVKTIQAFTVFTEHH